MIPVQMSISSRYVTLALVLLLGNLASGCQSLPVAESGAFKSGDGRADRLAEQIRARESLLVSRSRFGVDGGLGIWTDEETISARIDWNQAPERLFLILTGPMGMGTLNLVDEHGLATLTRGNTTISQGSNSDEVLQQGLGLAAPVPVQELGAWIRGLPGNASSVVRDEQGKLSSLRFIDRQGTQWQARFKRYSDWDGVQVPTLITASGGPYSVRLLLKNWQSASTTVVPQSPESKNRLPIPSR